MSCIAARKKKLQEVKSLEFITTLLFDWDGTLVDSARLGQAAFEKTFAELGVVFSQETYEATYSPNWYSVYEALGLPRQKWQLADDLWRRHYGQQPAQFVPGAAQTLLDLHRRGLRLGIVTSGNEDRVAREIEHAALPAIFDVVICTEHIVNKKPHPEGLEIALARLRRTPAESAYVGDAPEDVQMGKQAGVLTIGVRSNYPSSVRLLSSRPDIYLESITGLCDYFSGALESRLE